MTFRASPPIIDWPVPADSSAHDRNASAWRALLRVWRAYLTPPGRPLLGGACTALAAVTLLLLPGFAAGALDAAVQGDHGRVLRLAGAFGGGAVVEALLRRAGRLALIDRSRRTEEQLKDAVVRHLQRVRIPALDALRSGDVVSRLTQDVELLRFATGPAALYGLQALVLLPGGIVALAGASPRLALAAALPFAAMGLALWRLAPAIHRHSRTVQDELGGIAALAGDVLAALRFVRAAGREQAEAERMRSRSNDLADHKVELARVRARSDLAIHLGVELAVLAGLAIGGLDVLAGRATTGELLRLYALLGIALTPLLAAGFLLGALPRALAAARRVDELLALPVETVGAFSVARAPRAPRLELRSLTIARPGSDAPMLDGLSLTIEPGATLGIVGPVGAGKSALLDVLLRFREPPRGTVLVDGRDLLDVDPRELRALFGFVAQEPFLFADTIEQNLRLAAPDAPHDALLGAVEDAGLAPDLAEWPEGLRTRLGERGVTLSGGQRQRLSLARALLAGRPVLLLDDALSAVDHETERRILSALAKRRDGGTRIVVTHRLSAVAAAHRVAVLEDGRLTACDTPAALRAQRGFFATCWRLQAETAAFDGRLP
ncbi:MAG: ABC transporter ATP-binding protein [Planctomycetes bacterium]|nr:ABC transporter ATP-binding protein [Planctomycetota bacterium]